MQILGKLLLYRQFMTESDKKYITLNANTKDIITLQTVYDLI